MKVICVNNKIIDKYNPFNDSLSRLVEGNIYEVVDVIHEGLTIILKEVKSSHPNGGFKSERFREIDCDWADQLLIEISKKINTEELIY